MRAVTRFTAITVTMTVLLGAGIALGGPFALAALLYMTVFAFFMDKVTAIAGPDAPGAEFPAGTGLSVFLGLTQCPILAGAVWALASDTLHQTADKALIFGAVSLYVGQIGNANAHELIHRGNRWLNRLGAAVYGSILFGHHASAHLRIHHVAAATPQDPNTARLGEGYYAYAVRAWTGSLIEGFRAEARLRGGITPGHPYLGYALTGALALAAAWGLGGWPGLAWFVAIALYAQAQLLLSDYVQHYGLMRAPRPGGGWEAIGPQHSWNAPHGFSAAMMLNAPRHSDHHAHPSRAYPGLVLDRPAMPMLPQSLPVMAVIALWPPAWRRLMDKRAQRWSNAPETGPAASPILAE